MNAAGSIILLGRDVAISKKECILYGDKDKEWRTRINHGSKYAQSRTVTDHITIQIETPPWGSIWSNTLYLATPPPINEISEQPTYTQNKQLHVIAIQMENPPWAFA